VSGRDGRNGRQRILDLKIIACLATHEKTLDFERNHHIQQLAEKDKQIENLQGKYKGEEFRRQQDNQEKDRIIMQKDSIINDYRERIGHYLSTLSELL